MATEDPLFPHVSRPTTEGRFPGATIRSSSLVIEQGPHLPMWTADRAIYAVAIHLADAIPVVERERWYEIRTGLRENARQQGRDLTAEETVLLKKAFSDRIERYLSAGNGECLLRNALAAEAVVRVLEHDNGVKYVLHAYCVMPNHLHVIFTVEGNSQLKDILAEWKRISAHRINAVCGRTGTVWMEDAYTRIIRTAEEYRRQLSYVWANPEAAGLAEGFRRSRYVP